jgi:hypothetical protein
MLHVIQRRDFQFYKIKHFFVFNTYLFSITKFNLQNIELFQAFLNLLLVTKNGTKTQKKSIKNI